MSLEEYKKINTYTKSVEFLALPDNKKIPTLQQKFEKFYKEYDYVVRELSCGNYYPELFSKLLKRFKNEKNLVKSLAKEDFMVWVYEKSQNQEVKELDLNDDSAIEETLKMQARQIFIFIYGAIKYEVKTVDYVRKEKEEFDKSFPGIIDAMVDAVNAGVTDLDNDFYSTFIKLAHEKELFQKMREHHKAKEQNEKGEESINYIIKHANKIYKHSEKYQNELKENGKTMGARDLLSNFQKKYDDFNKMFPLVLRKIVCEREFYPEALRKFLVKNKGVPNRNTEEFLRKAADYELFVHMEKFKKNKIGGKERARIWQKAFDILKKEDKSIKKDTNQKKLKIDYQEKIYDLQNKIEFLELTKENVMALGGDFNDEEFKTMKEETENEIKDLENKIMKIENNEHDFKTLEMMVEEMENQQREENAVELGVEPDELKPPKRQQDVKEEKPKPPKPEEPTMTPEEIAAREKKREKNRKQRQKQKNKKKRR